MANTHLCSLLVFVVITNNKHYICSQEATKPFSDKVDDLVYESRLRGQNLIWIIIKLASNASLTFSETALQVPLHLWDMAQAFLVVVMVGD